MTLHPAPDGPVQRQAYRFGDFELRPHSRELLRHGRAVELQPKVFDFIACLLVHRGRVVDKNELFDVVWAGQVVTEAALTRCVMKARRALDDEADNPQVIRTVHGHGYRFVAPVVPVEEPLADAPDDLSAIPGKPAADTPTASAPTAINSPDLPATRRTRRKRLVGLGLALCALALVAIGGWWYGNERGMPTDGPVRLAVRPFENGTGESRLDWAGLGLMGAIGDILRSGGRVGVLGAREVLDLEPRLDGLDEAGRLARLRDIFGVTHLVEGRIERRGGQLRLDYVLVDPDGRRRVRTAVGADVTALAHAVGADLSVILGDSTQPPASEDSFANEAYLRGRALRLQGDIPGSVEYFRLASEQAPGAFWPRYELALARRDLGEREEASVLLRELLEEADANDDARQRLGARNALAILLWRAGEDAEAERLLDEALAIADRHGDPERSATVLVSRGIIATYRNDLEAARDYLTRAISAEAAAGHEGPTGNVLNSLAQVDLRAGDLVSAGRHLEGALARFRLTGDRRNEAVVLNGLADLRRREGRFEEARDLAGNVLAVHRALGNRTAEASALNGLAMAEAQLGHLRLAMEHASAALQLAESIGDRPTVANARSLLGQFSLDLGDHAAARRWLEGALEAWLAIDDTTGARRQRRHLARLDRAEGKQASAERQLLALHQELVADGPTPFVIDVLFDLARLRLDAGDPDGAARRLREALVLAEPLGNARRLQQLHAGLAEVALAGGDIAAAEAELARAGDTLAGDPDLLRVHAAMAAARGDASDALHWEQAARTAAGERWRPEDEARLTTRQRAARQ
ncbi:tetratricopeptide repeat protein [Marilutibacter alkalisoli]|uniref:Tetratricopeptide repeat protein n=1 Tax=Marilutibacter alkalisoli TaxID=2591633 RepID=A0A514BNH6_9GAMM|nr:tetratricopeptide repeat protein [Lysobacter alkalisoli]QDH68944.1 tetratricopeptide repeat protein [Lysobacter alkalisoli]